MSIEEFQKFYENRENRKKQKKRKLKTIKEICPVCGRYKTLFEHHYNPGIHRRDIDNRIINICLDCHTPLVHGLDCDKFLKHIGKLKCEFIKCKFFPCEKVDNY